MIYIIYMHSHVVVYMSCNELYVQATMMSTNQVGYIIVIAWVAKGFTDLLFFYLSI